MNKEFENFHRDHEDILSGLLENLDALLNKFHRGIVPGEPEKSDALYMLDEYKEALEIFYRDETPAFRRIKTEDPSFDEESIYKELSGEREKISLLMRLGREKIIAADDVIFQTDSGKELLQSNYFDEVIFEENRQHYYSLSAKGETVFKSKNLLERIKKDNVMAIVPNRMTVGAEKWNDLYVQRVELLNRYYRNKKANRDYILFALDDNKEMVFGCELNDSIDVTYTFAGIFDNKNFKQIDQLKKLAGSGLIDNIIILIDSNEMDVMLEDADVKKTDHIIVENVEVGVGN
jgi:hypothetical protein